MEIYTSPGRISKIENGRINPDKETIIDIAKALELETHEIASLFGIEVLDLQNLMPDVKRILLSEKVEEVVDCTVNNLVLSMGYVASVFFLVKDDKIFSKGITRSNISKKVLANLKRDFYSLSCDLSDINNLVALALKKNEPQLTHYSKDYIVPFVDEFLADKLQDMTGDKSNIVYPLVIGDKKFGAITFIKKIESEFDDERELLGTVAEFITIALRNAYFLTS